MSLSTIIADHTPISNFLAQLDFYFLMSKAQFQHVVNFITAVCQPGFNGTVTDLHNLSFSKVHRTAVGHFLNKSPWDEEEVLKAMQNKNAKEIWEISRKTKQPIYVLIDDTVSKKTKPSSKAKRMIQGCAYHHSHLERKRVYGHQVVVMLLQCNGIVLPYTLSMYEKASQSKIDLAAEALKTLPKPPYKGYVMADSWYSSQKIIQTSLKQGFHYIGALKTNRIIYPFIRSFPAQICEYATMVWEEDTRLVTVGSKSYRVKRYDGPLNGISQATVLLSWHEKAFGEDQALRAFICTEEGMSEEQILEHYAHRWPVEIYIRQGKSQLALNRYQIRELKGIKRYWSLLMLTYSYCCLGVQDEPCSFAKGFYSARQQTQQEIYRWIYEQGRLKKPIEEVFSTLKTA